jgi:Caspase domain
MGFVMTRLIAILACLILAALPAAAGKRVALVIGNSNYAHVTDLKNPKFDADLMEKTLRDVGFEVTRVSDVDQRGMKQALLDYGRKLREGADASMFYYAGHGIELNGVNYLVPVDADTRNSEEADIQNVSVNSFLALTENSGVPMNIIILDACRNNPFRSMRAVTDGGLAPVKAPRGTYVAYATSPGTVAADGDGENSPFTLALAESIKLPGLTLEAVLKQTRQKVQTLTNGAQLPYDNSAITGDFYFVPVVATTPTPVSPPSIDPAQAAYEAAGNDAAMLRIVADSFATSVWGALARERLKTLEIPAATETPPVPPAIEKIEPPKQAVVVSPPVAKRKVQPSEPVVRSLPKKAKAYEPPVRKAVRIPAPPREKARPKPRVKLVVVPKTRRVERPRARAASYPRCGFAFLKQGTWCTTGGNRICRVAFVSFRGGGGQTLLGCKQL